MPLDRGSAGVELKLHTEISNTPPHGTVYVEGRFSFTNVVPLFRRRVRERYLRREVQKAETENHDIRRQINQEQARANIPSDPATRAAQERDVAQRRAARRAFIELLRKRREREEQRRRGGQH